MKLDAFCHILPAAYAQRLFTLDDAPAAANLQKRVAGIPALVDLDLRFAQMDEFDEYRQVITLAAPPLEDLGAPARSVELARVGNEGLADLVERYPDRFAGFTACLPMNDPDAAVAEIEYAATALGASGFQIYTHVNGLPLDDPRFEPVWAKLAEVDKLIQVHPCRNASWPDYPTEQRSKYEVWWVFGWEYDLSAFMARVVFSGLLERYPGLKILVHHGGAMVPHFAGRIGPGWDQLGARTPDAQKDDVEGYPLTKRPIDYFRMFYADTALFGAPHALRCSLDFFGIDHVLFASDSPFDPEKGPGYIRTTIQDIEQLQLSAEDRAAIYSGNLRRLLGSEVEAAAS